MNTALIEALAPHFDAITDALMTAMYDKAKSAQSYTVGAYADAEYAQGAREQYQKALNA